MEHEIIHSVLAHLENHRISLGKILLYALNDGLASRYPFLTEDLGSHATQILSSLNFNSRTHSAVADWTNMLMQNRMASEVALLARRDNGWHFSAINAKADQILGFQIEEMAQVFCQDAPNLWALICALLVKGDEVIGEDEGFSQEEMSCEDQDEEEEYWVDQIDEELLLQIQIDEPRLEGSPLKPSSAVIPTKSKLNSQQKLRRALVVVKAVSIISICMQSQVQHCNAFQSTMGIFLHSCNAPEKLIKVLAHMGVSISVDSIHRALKSLYVESYHKVRELGQTQLAAFAYDNLDIKFNTLISTRMIQVMALSISPLDPYSVLTMVSLSRIFDAQIFFGTDPLTIPLQPTLVSLIQLQHTDILTLLKHGPSILSSLITQLRDPESVESIPVTKLQQVPIPAMDINPGSVPGNIQVLETFLSRCGLGDSLAAKVANTDIIDFSEMVSIVHGDLGCFEKAISGMKRRSVEFTELERLQFVVFVIGLFHMKMAAADAMWRIFMPAKNPSEDPSSFLNLMKKLRPNQYGRIQSSAKFRDQHELVSEVGIVLQLDAWRVEISRQFGKSLEEWAISEPSLQEIQEVADVLATRYVAGEGINIWGLRKATPSIRDRQYENILLTHQYLLLYEELSYSLNAGDIGRFETLLPQWISIFRSTGKHKYCNRLLQFMYQLYFVYPEGLRRAIRYNILVNPTGRPHQFRGADWVIELLNLYTKDVYGGSSSNYSKDRVLLESSIVLVLRNCHSNFERNFKLSGLSTAHAKKDMTATFKELQDYIKLHGLNETQPDRRVKREIDDMIATGQSAILQDSTKKRHEHENVQRGRPSRAWAFRAERRGPGVVLIRARRSKHG
ncbi:hypothetical protein NLI96_g11820 [Meripilus lineatus]|uniref:DUF6589 domain-containing protein n=1 Tax=Meripilus lineatus TaxID=2056292 RepID=A0AAD5Y8T0_9APHY|nr:hypothetical protein NLI96_g11820 [Physisporinus lineatus]